MSIQPTKLKSYVKNDFQILQEGVEKSVTYMSYGLERVKGRNFCGQKFWPFWRFSVIFANVYTFGNYKLLKRKSFFVENHL